MKMSLIPPEPTRRSPGSALRSDSPAPARRPRTRALRRPSRRQGPAGHGASSLFLCSCADTDISVAALRRWGKPLPAAIIRLRASARFEPMTAVDETEQPLHAVIARRARLGDPHWSDRPGGNFQSRSRAARSCRRPGAPRRRTRSALRPVRSRRQKTSSPGPCRPCSTPSGQPLSFMPPMPRMTESKKFGISKATIEASQAKSWRARWSCARNCRNAGTRAAHSRRSVESRASG